MLQDVCVVLITLWNSRRPHWVQRDYSSPSVLRHRIDTRGNWTPSKAVAAIAISHPAGSWHGRIKPWHHKRTEEYDRADEGWDHTREVDGDGIG